MLNDVVEPRKQKLYIIHKFDGSSDSVHRPKFIDTAAFRRVDMSPSSGGKGG